MTYFHSEILNQHMIQLHDPGHLKLSDNISRLEQKVNEAFLLLHSFQF